MRRPLVTIDGPDAARLQLAGMLKRLGFQVQVAPPRDWPAPTPERDEALLLAMESGEGAALRELLPLPLDAADLLRRLKDYPLSSPRRHLRLAVDLPAVIAHEGMSYIAELSSLGTGGAFVRSPLQRIDRETPLGLAIPLLGMQVELEFDSRMTYRVLPTEENGYLQGFGARFVSPPAEYVRLVEAFMRHALQEEDGGCGLLGLPPFRVPAAAPAVRPCRSAAPLLCPWSP